MLSILAEHRRRYMVMHCSAVMVRRNRCTVSQCSCLPADGMLFRFRLRQTGNQSDTSVAPYTHIHIHMDASLKPWHPAMHAVCTRQYPFWPTASCSHRMYVPDCLSDKKLRETRDQTIRQRTILEIRISLEISRTTLHPPNSKQGMAAAEKRDTSDPERRTH
jgi:hypothetical protein